MRVIVIGTGCGGLAAAFARACGDPAAAIAVADIGGALDALALAPCDAVAMALPAEPAAARELIERLRACREEVAVVAVLAHDADAVVSHAMQCGASDWILDGCDDPALLARALRNAAERRRVDLQLAQLAHFDSLTGLANRALFRNRLEHAIARAARRDASVALMFLDLDRFKAVNDSLGHGAGDRLLVAVAERLRGCVRDSDTVARLGGDEFTVVLEEVSSVDGVTVVAQKILKSMSAPFVVDGHELYVTPSIGITLYPDDDRQVDELLKNADAAMYKAKEQGRNTFQFYRADLHARSLDRFELEAKLRAALEREEFVLHYQPKIDVPTGRIVGVEALVRWQRPGEGLISPARFIPLAEETGLIVPIGEWVLREAARQAAAWRREGVEGLTIAVNLSPRQFRQANLPEVIAGALDAAGLPPSALECEITETLLMEDTASSSAALAALKERGIRISVDDFGTGYSSLSYLKRFPIDTLKIDQSFVRDITTDADDAAIASAVIALAHSLRLRVVAEGVETGGQLDFLRERGCDLAQGYLFSRPVAADAIVSLVRAEALAASASRPRAASAAGTALVLPQAALHA